MGQRLEAETFPQLMDEHTTLTRQRLIRGVADLSASLRRPVALHDVNFGPIACSPHEGPLDASRLEMIFGRPFPKSVRAELVEREHIERAAGGPRYIEGFSGLDLGRAFIPVLGTQGQAVGYVWAIDVERSWSLPTLEEMGRTVSRLLGPDLEQLVPSNLECGPVLDRAAAGAPGHRAALIDISLAGAFDPNGLTYQGALERFETGDIAARFGLDIAAVSQVRDGKHQTELVLAGSLPSLERKRIRRVIDALVDRFCGFDPINRATGRTLVSAVRRTGSSVEPVLHTLRDALAATSDLNPEGAVEFVEDSQVFQLLAELRDALGADGYQTPDSVTPLIADQRTRVIARTVKALLDSDANAQETAERLFIHRGTLYNRINQAQALTGMSLTGVDRVRMHLGLIIAELTGAI